MLIGNDVVDLRDDETKIGNLHPRFMMRVFAPEERRCISESVNPHRALWMHWAAKEAAYKLLKKLVPETVFAPAAFRVEFADDGRGKTARGTVSHVGSRLFLQVGCLEDCIHAVASSGRGEFLSNVASCRSSGDDSAAVRAYALRDLGLWLGKGDELHISGSRPPRLCRSERPLAVDLSLSHHGRWLAWAAAHCGRATGSQVAL